MPVFETDNALCDIRKDLLRYDADKLWNVVYERLKNQSTFVNKEASINAARDIQNRWKNRYRDINPYDSTRVFLNSGCDGDYINANYVWLPGVPSRRYILTQGPMRQTVSHFWQMLWERQSLAIVMLNRIFEKGAMQCYPYFPSNGDSTRILLDDVGLCIRLEQESDEQYFVQRKFLITNSKTNEERHVIHLHYIGWPDFGVPRSPSGVLNFLWAVRSSGALNDPDRPVVIHCSAGVGRSGAFVLIDLALHLVETRGTLKGMDLSEIFVDLRRCRMGLIQTADQLRFCFLAVVLGAEKVLAVSREKVPFIHFQPDSTDDYSSSDSNSEDDDWNGSVEVEYDSCVNDDYTSNQGLEWQENEEKMGLITSAGHSPVRHLTHHQFRNNKRSADTSLSRSTTVHRGLDFEGESADHYFSTFNRVTPGSAEIKDGLITRISTECSKPAIGDDVYSATDRDRATVVDCVDNLYRKSMFRDRRNNAVLMTSSDEANQVVTSNPDRNQYTTSVEPVGVITHSTSSLLSVNNLNTSTERVSTADGDSACQNPDESRTPVSSCAPTADTLHNARFSGAHLDPLTSAYLEASSDLRNRREARRLRQTRIREHVKATRERMRAADLERERWLSSGVMHYMRRFFAESGYVQSPLGAAVSTTLLLLVAFGVTALLYSHWFTV